MTAKSAPPSRTARRGTAYPPFPTEGGLLFNIKTSGWPELRRVTKAPHIAGPLDCMSNEDRLHIK